MIPPWRSIASRSIASRAASAAGSCALIITSTWIWPRPNGASQCSGALSPTSPSMLARAAIPTANSSGKPASDVPGTPIATSPAYVKAMLIPDSGFVSHGSAVSTSGVVSASSARARAASSMRRNR